MTTRDTCQSNACQSLRLCDMTRHQSLSLFPLSRFISCSGIVCGSIVCGSIAGLKLHRFKLQMERKQNSKYSSNPSLEPCLSVQWDSFPGIQGSHVLCPLDVSCL